jgi:hypothetical protein
LHYLFDSNAVRTNDEDAFSSGEGGVWAWYPASATFAPRPLGWWWLAAGEGAPAFGSITRTGDQIRFVPNAFWSSRGLSDWERNVHREDVDGAWRRLTFDDGVTIIRDRRLHRR